MDMEFKTTRFATLVGLTVSVDNAEIVSGLMDRYGAIDMAKDLIYAAECLLPPGTAEYEQRLSAVREDLG